MKKRIFAVCSVVVLILAFLPSIQKRTVGESKLYCDQNGDFTILIVSDPQCDSITEWYEAKNELETLVKRAEPDFVLINGDMNTYNEIPAAMWNVFISPLTSRNIPWSTTNGNHDPYTKRNYKIYKSYKNCFNSLISRGNVNYEKSRPMNYVIPIYSNDAEHIVFAIYGMDTGTENKYGYEGLTERQIAWYVEQSNALKQQNNGQAVTSLMCMHIPIPQVIDMFYSNSTCAAARPKTAGDVYTVYGVINQSGVGITGYICENQTYIKNSYINTTALQNDRGVFEQILKQGDVKIMIFGHEHTNNIVGSYKGVLLGFAGKLSTGCYSDTLCRGGRVIRFNQSNPSAFTTEWLGSMKSSKDQPKIYSDGTLAE